MGGGRGSGDPTFFFHESTWVVVLRLHTENQRPRCPGSGLKVCVARKADICFAQGGYMVCKPNLVKCFGPRLRLWTCALCQGQAFQY